MTNGLHFGLSPHHLPSVGDNCARSQPLPAVRPTRAALDPVRYVW